MIVILLRGMYIADHQMQATPLRVDLNKQNDFIFVDQNVELKDLPLLI